MWPCTDKDNIPSQSDLGYQGRKILQRTQRLFTGPLASAPRYLGGLSTCDLIGAFGERGLRGSLQKSPEAGK